MKTTYHTHCNFCDGRASMEDMVKAAVKEGFRAYGVSSHAPQPFENSWTMAYENMPLYLEEFNRLKEKYRDDIQLYVGLEIDFIDGISHPASQYFQELPLDYRIASVHAFIAPDGELIDVDAGEETFKNILEKKYKGDLKKLVGQYFYSSMQMVQEGGFDFVGHCDKIHHNAEAVSPGCTDEKWYLSLLDDYFNLIREKGIMLEINTKGLLKKGCFFPAEKSFSRIKELGIPILVNSDAHRPELVNSGREEAIRILKAKGFETIKVLLDGEWKDDKITS